MAARLHHVGVHVEDLGRSIAFYEAVFGMRVVQRFVLGDEELAFLDGGPGLVELIADGGGARASAGVVDHVAFEVGDLERGGGCSRRMACWRWSRRRSRCRRWARASASGSARTESASN